MKRTIANIARHAIGPVLCLALCMACLQSWRGGQARIQQLAHLPKHEAPALDVSPLNPPAAAPVDVAMLRDNALFYSRRTFYQPPPPVQTVPPPDYEFAGSMLSPQGKRVAFLRKRSDHSSRLLHAGDDLDGWHVEGVESNKVMLSRADAHLELASSVASAPSMGLSRASSLPKVARMSTQVLGTAPIQGVVTPTAKDTVFPAPRFYQPPPQ